MSLPQSQSLQARLKSRLKLSAASMVCLLWLASVAALFGLMAYQLNKEQTLRSFIVLSGLDIQPDKPVALSPSVQSGAYLQPYSGEYFLVQMGNTQLQSRSVWDFNWQPEQGLLIQDGPLHQWLWVTHHAYTRKGQPIHIWVGVDVSMQLAGLFGYLLFTALLGWLGVALLLYWQKQQLNASFQPVQELLGQVDKISSGQLKQLAWSGPSELNNLVSQFNNLIQTLDQRTETARQASSNLAHSLRTRLGQFQHAIQNPALQPQIDQLLDFLSRTIARETLRLRVAGPRSGQQHRVYTVLNDLTQTLPKLYADKNLRVQLQADTTAELPMDPNDLLELAGILLDNACKWANHRVIVAVVPDHTLQAPQHLSLIIEDDGPGSDHTDTLGKSPRGTRFDEQTPGSGIGLHMAQDLCKLYQATLAFDQSPNLGGLRATVQWLATESSQGIFRQKPD